MMQMTSDGNSGQAAAKTATEAGETSRAISLSPVGWTRAGSWPKLGQRSPFDESFLASRDVPIVHRMSPFLFDMSKLCRPVKTWPVTKSWRENVWRINEAYRAST